jgi:cation:H+ antiporter
MTLLLFFAGLALLTAGGELLVRGASKLARAVGISPLVVGLTVVAFGTSAPELAVSVQAAFAGQADIAVGNVIGSNIFNVLFILGCAAIIRPLIVSRQLVQREVPVMVGVSFVAFALALDGNFGRLDGMILFSGVVLYTTLAIRMSRRETREAAANGEAAPSASPREIGLRAAQITGGLLMLVLGARWLVASAVEMARSLGVSELVISLTIIAAGTSLPEVAASIVATVRGEREIAVGNVVGSNIFNLLSILGITALVAPDGIRVAGAALAFDFPVMLAVAVACLPIFFTGHLISRWEGILFLGYYAAYVVYLVLGTQHHATLPVFSGAMMGFVIPLSAITLLIFFWRAHRAGRIG